MSTCLDILNNPHLLLRFFVGAFFSMLVCVAIDVSSSSSPERALELARGVRGRVLLVGVVGKESEAEHAKELLSKLCKEKEECVVLVGDSPGKMLVSFVETFAPHILVVSASSKGPIETIFFGSCASFVLKNAKCNVLLAR